MRVTYNELGIVSCRLAASTGGDARTGFVGHDAKTCSGSCIERSSDAALESLTGNIRMLDSNECGFANDTV